MRSPRKSWIKAVTTVSLLIIPALFVLVLMSIRVGPSPQEAVRLKRAQMMRAILMVALEYEHDHPGTWPSSDMWRPLLETHTTSYSLDDFGPLYFLRPSDGISNSAWNKQPALFEDPSQSSSSKMVVYWDGTFESLKQRDFRRLILIDLAERIE